MNKFNNWLINEPKNLSTSCFFWNMIGSMSLALGTMVLTILVNRIVGDYVGGDFAMALATGQLMATIGYFETRTYQVTDSKKEFSFSDYYTIKIITNIAMILLGIGYILIKGYDLQKSILVVLLCIYKMMDTFADVFEGEFHHEERLDISGKSLTVRTVVSILGLVLTLIITKNIYISCFVAILLSIVIIYFFNIRIMKGYESFGFNFDLNKIRNIIYSCFPLFLSSFMSTYILNSSRYAIEATMTSDFHSKYTAIFLPVSTINLLVGFIFKPMLTGMAKNWNEKKYGEFTRSIFLVLICVFVTTIITMIGAYILGIPVLSLLYKTDLSGFKTSLLILLIGGGLNAANAILYNALSVMRNQKIIMIAYVVTFLISLYIPNLLASRFGIIGAAYSFSIVMFILTVQLLICTFLSIVHTKNNF